MFLGETQSEHSEGTALKGGGGHQKQQGNQELTDNKTACPKEITSCQCETFVKKNQWQIVNNRTAKGRALTGSVGLYQQQQQERGT